MKRFIISALLLVGIFSVKAQETATTSLNYSALEKKFTKSNEAIMDEKAKIKPATWFSRGELLQDIHDVNTELIRLGMTGTEVKLYMGDPEETKTNDEGQVLHVYERITLIFENEMVVDWIETQIIHEDPLPLAIEAYNEALRLDEKDKLNEKVHANLDRLKSQAENDAIRHFTKDEFDKCVEKFELIMKASESTVYDGFIDSVIIYNTALAAKNGGMHDVAAGYFKKTTEINYGGSDAYFLLMKEYITLKDSTKALATLQEGFQKYPDTTLILFELVNYYLGAGNADEGMRYLELAQEQETTNPSIYFAKGTLYERMGEPAKAIENYEKSLELDPEFYNSWFNIGAIHFNTAVELYEVANSKEDLEEYNKAKAEADEALQIAVVPMEKAQSLNPDDTAPLETLQTIYYRLGMTEKYDEVKARLAEMDQ